MCVFIEMTQKEEALKSERRSHFHISNNWARSQLHPHPTPERNLQVEQPGGAGEQQGDKVR